MDSEATNLADDLGMPPELAVNLRAERGDRYHPDVA